MSEIENQLKVLYKKMEELEGKVRPKITWLGVVKFFLGTLLLGGATLFLDNSVQQIELTQKATQQKQDYIAQFIDHAMNENIEIRIRFARYFKAHFGGEWQDYLKTLISERDENIQKEAKAIARLDVVYEELKVLRQANLKDDGQSDSKNELEGKLKEEAQLQRELKSVRRELEAVETQSVQFVASGWMYFGKYDGKKWTDQTVGISGKPEAQRYYRSLTRVYIRDRKPSRGLGEIINGINRGVWVFVYSIEVNEESNSVWARVSVLTERYTSNVAPSFNPSEG